MCETIDNWLQEQNKIFKNVMGARFFNTKLAEERNLMLKGNFGMLNGRKNRRERRKRLKKQRSWIDQGRERENRKLEKKRKQWQKKERKGIQEQDHEHLSHNSLSSTKKKNEEEMGNKKQWKEQVEKDKK